MLPISKAGTLVKELSKVVPECRGDTEQLTCVMLGVINALVMFYKVQFKSEVSDEKRIFALLSSINQQENPTVTFPMDDKTGLR